MRWERHAAHGPDERSVRRDRLAQRRHRLRAESNWTAAIGPNLEQVRLRFFGSKEGMFTSFLNGEIDLTLNTTPADLPALESVDPGIGTVRTDPGWHYEHLDFNFDALTGLDDLTSAGRCAWPSTSRACSTSSSRASARRPRARTPRRTWWRRQRRVRPVRPRGRRAALDELGWVFDPTAAVAGARDKDGVACASTCARARATRPASRPSVAWPRTSWRSASRRTSRRRSSVYFDSWERPRPRPSATSTAGRSTSRCTPPSRGDPYGDYYHVPLQPHPDRSPATHTRIADPELDADLENARRPSSTRDIRPPRRPSRSGSTPSPRDPALLPLRAAWHQQSVRWLQEQPEHRDHVGRGELVLQG